MSTPKRRREEDGQPRMSGTRTKMQLEIPHGNTRAFPEEDSRPDRQELTAHALPRKKCARPDHAPAALALPPPPRGGAGAD
jgi:hypothetical protein